MEAQKLIKKMHYIAAKILGVLLNQKSIGFFFISFHIYLTSFLILLLLLSRGQIITQKWILWYVVFSFFNK